MMVVVVVVVWTVSWPRRERCPGTLRVTIPRPLRRFFSSFSSTAVSLFLHDVLSLSLSILSFSFLSVPLGQAPARVPAFILPRTSPCPTTLPRRAG